MRYIKTLILPLLALMISMPAWAEDTIKPFILASKVSGDKRAVVSEVKSKLGAAGFVVVGEYTPYPEVTIVAITNDALKNAAAEAKYGAYAAAQRVSITQHNDEVQVAYTSPIYMANAYRMDASLADVESALAEALGNQGQYGPKEGLTTKKLRKYHYMFGMPYMDDPDELAEYDSYEQAVAAVEDGLATGNSGTSKVYRIDLPGNKTLFGVGMTKGQSSDEYIMSEIDFKDVRSSAHLPYEIFVDGKEIYALNAKFRIAINFPDLKMMGANSFMNIMSSPGQIRTALAHAAGVEPPPENEQE